MRAQIEELARSVPAALTRDQPSKQRESTPEPSSATNANIANKRQTTGIWGLTSDLVSLSGKKHTLQDELDATEALKKDAQQLRAPMLDYLKGKGVKIGGVTQGERGMLWYDETGRVQRMPALVYHLPWPGIGHFVKQGDGFRYVAEPMRLVL